MKINDRHVCLNLLRKYRDGENQRMSKQWLNNMDSEKHYTAKEIAEAWNLSQDTVQRIFLNEPGVLVIGCPTKRYKRTKRTLRIPASVRFRVYQRLRNHEGLAHSN